MQKIVGIIGRRGAGKDTAAKVFIEHGYRRIAFADALYQEVCQNYQVSQDWFSRRKFKERPMSRLAYYYSGNSEYVIAMMHFFGCIEPSAEEKIRDAAFMKQKKRHIKRQLQQISPIFTRLFFKHRSPRESLQNWAVEYRRTYYNEDYWVSQVESIIKDNPDTNFVITDVRHHNEERMSRRHHGVLLEVLRPSQDHENDVHLQHSSENEMREWERDFTFLNEEGKMLEMLAVIKKTFF